MQRTYDNGAADSIDVLRGQMAVVPEKIDLRSNEEVNDTHHTNKCQSDRQEQACRDKSG